MSLSDAADRFAAELSDETREHIRRTVDAAPPVSEAQRARLRELLAPYASADPCDA